MDRVIRVIARLVGWAFAPVEDAPAPNVIPMPGPAHGPIPAIELRVDEMQRRLKAS